MKNRYASTTLKVITNILSFFIALIALLFGSVASSENLKQFMFYKFAINMLLADNPALDPIRCDHFRNISGRVLEIGPGPATNFRCWGNLTSVTEWVGVEPNNYFKEVVESEKIKYNITFPTRSVWLKGEDVDVEPGSFDYVVGAHVLCSVDSVSQVLHQVSRALKPGGKYIFMEHVAAPKESLNYYAQMIFVPFVNGIANGCQFRELWKDVDEHSGLPGFDVQLQHISIDMGVPIFSPHILGTATKR